MSPPKKRTHRAHKVSRHEVQNQQRTKRGNRKHNDTPVPVVVTQLLSLPDIDDNDVPAATATLAKRPTLIVPSKQKEKPVVIKCSELLSWIRDKVPLPSHAASKTASSVKKQAKHYFRPVTYSPNTVSVTKRRRVSSRGSVVTQEDNPPPEGSNCSASLPSSSHLRRLLIEDIVTLDPGSNEILILCVSPAHAAYADFKIVHDQAPLQKFTIRQSSLLQIRVRVVHNARRDELIGGLLDRSTFHHLLLENGNGAIGLVYCDIARHTAIYVNWKDFFLNCESLHLWGSSPMQRPWRTSLRAKFSKATRLQFFRRLVLELDGDVAQTLELCAAMESLDDHVNPLVVPAPPPVVDLTSRATVSVELSDTVLDGLNTAVSNLIQKRMELCFGGFVSWSDPIITSNDLDHLCDLMYDAVPQQVSAIMSMLGYDIKQNQGRSAHLVNKFFP